MNLHDYKKLCVQTFSHKMHFIFKNNILASNAANSTLNSLVSQLNGIKYLANTSNILDAKSLQIIRFSFYQSHWYTFNIQTHEILQAGLL